MKVKFNLPVSRHQSKLNFDYNSTFDFGQIQPSLCKFSVPKAKYSIDFAQLIRTAPLVVPSFGRMAFHNLFCYVPISMIMPSFDAFLSQTKLSGTSQSYIPASLPCTTNKLLCCYLFKNPRYSSCYSYEVKVYGVNPPAGHATGHYVGNKSQFRYFQDGLNTDVAQLSETFAMPDNPAGYVFDYQLYHTISGVSYVSFYKLTQLGRQLYNVLRGLGYSLDYTDNKPVSALPILAFGKASYDLLFPHRDTPFHSTLLYKLINGFYNGNFDRRTLSGHSYDFIGIDVPDSSSYSALLDSLVNFLLAPVGSDITQVATASPILPTSSSPLIDGITYDDPQTSTGLCESPRVDGKTLIPSLPSLPMNRSYTADCLRLVDRLWSFVQRSSAVGQDVRNWFKLHFGVQPTEDMFSQTVLFKDVVNQLNVNTVVSTADTSKQDGEVLGGLAGQSYSAETSKLSFEVPNFGFVLCLSYVVPIARTSSGTQPELYNCQYWDLPMPDFDGLGYETLNASSFQENTGLTVSDAKNKGFGFVPRLTSYKVYNNVRSGGFSLPSLRDNYIPYCLDKILYLEGNLTHVTPAGVIQLPEIVGPPDPLTSEGYDFYFPYPSFSHNPNALWRTYDNIFYNSVDVDGLGNRYSPNNFMCQSSFGISISSYLKPISDSFEIDNLFKQVTAVKKS